MLAVAQHLLQIKRADHAVLGCADGQFDEAGITVDGGQHGRKATHGRRLRGALLAADQHAADLGPHRAQHQREAQLVLSDERAERVGGRHGLP